MNASRTHRTLRRGLLAVAGLGLLVACTVAVSSSGEESVPPPLLPPTATLDLDVEAEQAPQQLPVTAWGGTGHELAVVIENDTGRTVEQAQVTIVGLDESGNPVTSFSSEAADPCCSILGLPASSPYGLFATLDRPVDELSAVEVRLDAVTLADEVPPRLDVERSSLELTADDAVVTARLSPRGDVTPYIVGQAVLVDADERPVGVISGRFYCFDDREPRTVRMELLRPAPPGTAIGQVMAYPIPTDVSPGAVAGSCDS